MDKVISAIEVKSRLDSLNKTSILCKGAYDIIHAGHILSFQNAKKHAEILIVGINTDDAIYRRKGPGRPFHKLEERLIVLSSIDIIDYIVVYSEESPFDVIEKIQPTFLAASHFNFFNSSEFKKVSNFTKLILLPKVGDSSTSNIIQGVKTNDVPTMIRKLNLHLKLDKSIYEFVINVNNDVKAITSSLIDFTSKENPMIPHITIIMGYLDESKFTLKEIIEKSVFILRDYKSLSFKLGDPYIENVKRNYVFSDIELDSDFKLLQKRLFDVLESDILKVQMDFNKQPHLTLGHVTQNHSEVTGMLNEKYKGLELKGISSSVEISDVGPKGTCINSIWSYEL